MEKAAKKIVPIAVVVVVVVVVLAYFLLVKPATEVTEADFTIDVSPNSESVAQGGSTTVTVSATQVNGYSQTVSLSASGQLVGVTVSFSPDNGTPNFTSTMTIDVETSVPPGDYTIIIAGTGGDGKLHTCTYTLTVTEADFTIDVSPNSGEVVQGGLMETTVTVTPSGDYSYTVDLNASDQPSSVTVTFSPSSGTPNFTSTMTIDVGTVPPGDYTIIIAGTGGDGKLHTCTYTLTVTEVTLITKSPEEMVLKLSDVPSENYSGIESRSITIEYLQSAFSYLPANIWQQAGFEDGCSVSFNYQGRSYFLNCAILRFSSIEGAKILFNAMENSVTGYPTNGRFVTIPKIGDQHFAMEYSTPAYPGAYQPVGIGFRKANVCVFLSTYGSLAPWVMDDVVGWAQIVENRIS